MRNDVHDVPGVGYLVHRHDHAGILSSHTSSGPARHADAGPDSSPFVGPDEATLKAIAPVDQLWEPAQASCLAATGAAPTVERELAEVRSLGRAGRAVSTCSPRPGMGGVVGEVDLSADRLRNQAQVQGVDLGDPQRDDDQYNQKLDLICEQAVPVVSLTFGCRHRPRLAGFSRLARPSGSPSPRPTVPEQGAPRLILDQQLGAARRRSQDLPDL